MYGLRHKSGIFLRCEGWNHIRGQPCSTKRLVIGADGFALNLESVPVWKPDRMVTLRVRTGCPPPLTSQPLSRSSFKSSGHVECRVPAGRTTHLRAAVLPNARRPLFGLPLTVLRPAPSSGCCPSSQPATLAPRIPGQAVPAPDPGGETAL